LQLIDFGWKYSFGLNHVMTADELQNCLPQSDDCWGATTAQQWAQIMEARSFSAVPSLPQTIADQNWIWARSQTGTLGKQTILHYLTSIVTKDDADSSSQGCWSEKRLAAAATLKSLLGEELGEGHTKAAVLHRVLICSGLMIHYSPTLRIKSFCLRVIYRRMDDTSWDLLMSQWAKSPFQGRLAVLYGAQVFETIRLNRCAHFLTPASLLRAALVLWIYSTLCQRYGLLERGCPGPDPNMEPSAVLDLECLETAGTKRWIANGSGCLKLPGIGNLLCHRGARRLLDESIVVMNSLSCWSISSSYVQLLQRIQAVGGETGGVSS
jgi:hypothetical protein